MINTLLIYNYFKKELTINEDEIIGNLLEKIINIFNLTIYNIESIILYLKNKDNNNENKFIFGSSELLYSMKIKTFLDININSYILKIEIIDKKYYYNENIEKKNTFLDSYHKWYQEKEISKYIEHINNSTNYFESNRNQITNNIELNNINNLENISLDEIKDNGINLHNLDHNNDINNQCKNINQDFTNIIFNNIQQSNFNNLYENNNQISNINFLNINENNNNMYLDNDDINDNHENNNNINDNTNNDNINMSLNHFQTYNEELSDKYTDELRNNILNITSILQNEYISKYINIVNNFENNIINSEIDYVHENIIIALSEEEFEIIKKNNYYSFKDNNQLSCNICLEILEENSELINLNCKHIFHCVCIKNWLTKHSNKCPVCRKEVSKGKPINL